MISRLVVIIIISLLLNTRCGLDETDKYMRQVQSENVILKKNAIIQLGMKKEKSAVPILVTLVEDNQSKEIRLAAIKALGDIKDKNAVIVLIGVLREGDTRLGKAAVESLGKIGDSRAVPDIIQFLNKNNEPSLTAIWALGNIGDGRAIPTLTGLLNNKNKYVRYDAAQSLKKIRSKE